VTCTYRSAPFTRDGRRVRLICTDAAVKSGRCAKHPIGVVLVARL
jgi:hypothetical protein